ncbi:hypothetical protein RD792_003214 [Penstemon davidsonii]|uniref:Glutamate receptor n=1 Tax=Penstemon davidsonii TaxID=160366 RepID=A0ABR0DT52_9LAMI|nr:hypothetical protein RD792_003214 [Penstemon davidsonii]
MFFFSSLYVSLICAFFCLCSNAQTEVQHNGSTLFNVGVVLDLDSLVGRIGMTSLTLALSDYYSVDRNYSAKLVLHVRDSKGQIIDAAASALSLLNDIQVDAIIGPQKSAQSTFVVGLGDRAHVPIISFSATSPSLHPQAHYFVQTAITDSFQVDVIVDIVKYFQWNQVVLINEESDYGNGINPYLSNALQDANARVSYRSVIPLEATDDFLLLELYMMKTMQTRVFVVHISSSLASKFFLKVKEAGMMSEGYVWIVTSGLMDLLYSLDSNVVNTMEGVLGVKPLMPRTTRLTSTAIRWKNKFNHDNPDFSQAEFGLFAMWAYDALWALAMAAERIQFTAAKNTSLLNSTDVFITEISKTGPKLREALSEVTFEGLGGKFHLVNGQLVPSAFQILNVVGKGERGIGVWTNSEGILSESNNGTNSSSKKLKSVVFPGDTTNVPKGWEVPVSGKKLRVGVPVNAGFDEFVKVKKDPQTNVSKVSGCYIDMFEAVMAELQYAVPYEYIPFETPDGLSAGNYDDLCFQVSLQKYDVAVGDITITSKRSNYVDFTLPFEAGGVTMTMLRNYDSLYNEWFFLEPFEKKLWLTAIGLFVFTGFVVWVLEHRSSSAFRGPLAHHVGMIFYFPFMSLVYAQRERIVSNYARFVVVVWMFVVLILNSTYTASLSAKLTVERLLPTGIDVNDLIRNGDNVGCRDVSFIFNFLQQLGFDKSKIKTYSSPMEMDAALANGTKGGGISALFSVMPYTKLFLSKYPKYTTNGTTYSTEGFAFVFEKGSPLVADVSRAVIKVIEDCTLSKIEGRWIKDQKGAPEGVASSDLTTATLKMFQSLFGISGGIATTCLLVFIATYMYENRDFVRRISNSSTTIRSKARAIGKHFDQRDPKSFRTSKYREDGVVNASPSLNENARPSTVVPIDLNDANEDIGPNSENTNAANQQIRSTDNIEIVRDV